MSGGPRAAAPLTSLSADPQGAPQTTVTIDNDQLATGEQAKVLGPELDFGHFEEESFASQ